MKNEEIKMNNNGVEEDIKPNSAEKLENIITENNDKKQNDEENKMGTEPVLKLLTAMSIPAMFSMLVQAMYNIVDSFFVAKIGKDALDAVSLAFPIQILMIGVAVGTGIGINSLISRSLGANKIEYANKVATYSIFLGVISGAVFALIGFLFTENFFQLFTNDETLILMGSQYASTVMIFSVGIFLQINIEKTLQSTGDMLNPMLIQLFGAVINIVLDPILIFGLFGAPEMGIFGAAVATVIGQLGAMVIGLYVLLRKQKNLKITLKGFRPELSIISKIYKVGLPSIIMQSIGSFVVVVMNNILISLSTSAVAVFGIYFKLSSFVSMPVFGITFGAMPIFGYNFGAKKRKRIMECLKYAMIASLVIMLAGTAVFFFFGKELLMIFDATPDMIAIGTSALAIMGFTFPLLGINVMISSLFQSIGHANKGLIITVIRQVLVSIPFALIMSKYIGINAVWIAYPLAELVASFVGIYYVKKIYNKDLKNL